MDSSDAGQQAEIAPPIEFGIAATCIGTVALLLFFLPILSIPIAICGLLAGMEDFSATAECRRRFPLVAHRLPAFADGGHHGLHLGQRAAR